MPRMTTSSASQVTDEVVQTSEKERGVTLHCSMLSKMNYSVWAIKMLVNLQEQGVWNAVQNSEVDERKDRIALAAIYQAIPEDVLLMLVEKDTAKEAWETLGLSMGWVWSVLGAEIAEIESRNRNSDAENSIKGAGYDIECSEFMKGLQCSCVYALVFNCGPLYVILGPFPRSRTRKSKTFRSQYIETKELKLSVNTWNLGGELPPDDLNIKDLLNTTTLIYILRKHIKNVHMSTVGVGAMGFIGNKGSISASMCIYETNYCFICTHLTSPEREVDLIKRNAEVGEIHKRTSFNSMSKVSLPRTIKDHERIIWLGDLNYRINLPYEETRDLISKSDWSKLLESD
ncbi:hypothetical protein LXL04_003450 [Taraxacum kok-saghyz]